MNVTIFTKPDCQACNATKRHLSRLEIPFEEVNVLADHHAAQRLREMNSLKLPRVEVTWFDGRDSWTGYRPTKIEELQDRYETSA